MCLLVVQKPNKKMKNQHIENAWERNSDGGGYSFAVNGKIITKKFMELDDFKTSFNNDWNGNKNSSFLIHFRYATHGLTNIDNVHPFKVNNNLVFGHNGIINCVDDDCTLSDTQVFNNTILKNLKSNFLNSKAIRLLISESIHNSKLAFLDNNGRYTIINSDLGSWNEISKIFKKNKLKYFKKSSTFFRPWGKYINLYSGKGFLVKELTVNPFSSISLQKHIHRSEFWTITNGKPKITINSKKFFKSANAFVHIPKGAIHRIENVFDKPVKIIEIQTGSILKETDIIRYKDVYGRIN